MNTFIISKNCSIIFNRVCHSPPSLEDIALILAVLEEHKFSNLGYRMDIIHGNNHRKITGIFYSASKFFDYFTNLCEEERIKFGIVMYLNN